MRRRLGSLLAVVAAAAATIAPADAAPPPYTVPPYAEDFPDPFVVRSGGRYFAYATSGRLGHVQVISSPDLSVWTPVGDAMPDGPSWARGGAEVSDDVWAPAVLDTAGAGWVLFSSVVAEASGKRCISRAVSGRPEGPFVDLGLTPFVCDDERNGAIDPSVVQSPDGRRWLLWKSEGVPGREPPRVWSQELGGDGAALLGTPHELIRADQPWEFPIVENPAMFEDGGRWYLLYSGNRWDTRDYAIGWAVCASPEGPCAKAPNRTLVESEGSAHLGPGAPEIVRDTSGSLWLVYHAWTGPVVGYPQGRRMMRFRALRVIDGRPVVAAADGSFDPPPVAERVAGPDRYATAAEFAATTVPPSSPVVYLATGESFADALAGSAAAGVENSPVLLVGRDHVPEGTRAELARLRPGHIVVLGGQAAVSDGVYAAVAPYANGSIHREPGADRYDTAARVSANTFRDGAPVAYVATGDHFPDALAAGAAGAARGGPVLLVRHDEVPQVTDVELGRLRPGRIVVVGGPAAVSDAVAAAIGRHTTGGVTRVAGTDRYATAALVAERELPAPVGGLVVATGERFPDAVAGGAAGFPVLLVPPTGAPPGLRQTARRLGPQGAIVLGGTAAVPDAAVHSLGW